MPVPTHYEINFSKLCSPDFSIFSDAHDTNFKANGSQNNGFRFVPKVISRTNTIKCSSLRRFSSLCCSVHKNFRLRICSRVAPSFTETIKRYMHPNVQCFDHTGWHDEDENSRTTFLFYISEVLLVATLLSLPFVSRNGSTTLIICFSIFFASKMPLLPSTRSHVLNIVPGSALSLFPSWNHYTSARRNYFCI